jgi:hypothetical protein
MINKFKMKKMMDKKKKMMRYLKMKIIKNFKDKIIFFKKINKITTTQKPK